MLGLYYADFVCNKGIYNFQMALLYRFIWFLEMKHQINNFMTGKLNSGQFNFNIS